MSKNIFDTATLIEWLETKDPEDTYNYARTTGCLLYQYFKAKGVAVSGVWSDDWVDTAGYRHDLPVGWDAIANHEGMTTRSVVGMFRAMQTYGGALAKARELVAAGTA